MLAMYERKGVSNSRMDSLALNTEVPSQTGDRMDNRTSEHVSFGSYLARHIAQSDENDSRRFYIDNFTRAPLLSSKRKLDGVSGGVDDDTVSKKMKPSFSLPLIKRSLKPIPPLLSYCSKDKTFSEMRPAPILDKGKMNHGQDASPSLDGRQFLFQTTRAEVSQSQEGSHSPTSHLHKHQRPLMESHARHREVLRANSTSPGENFEVASAQVRSTHQLQFSQVKASPKRVDYKSVTNLLSTSADDEESAHSPKSRETSPEKIEVKRSAFREVTKRKPPTDSPHSAEVDSRLHFNERNGTERQVSPIGTPFNLGGYKPQVSLRPFSNRFSDLLNRAGEHSLLANHRHLSPTSMAHAPTFSTRSDISPNIGKSASPTVIGVTCPVGAFRPGVHQDMLTASKSAFSPPSQSPDQLAQPAGIMDYLQKTSPIPKTAFPTPSSSSQYYDSIRRAFKNFSDKSSPGILPGMLSNGADQVRFSGVPLPPPSGEVGALSSFPGYPRLYDSDPAAMPFPLQKSPSQSIMPLTATALNFAQNWCAKCNATFRMTSDLVYHMRTHHKRDHADPVTKRKREEKLRCNICGETFRERHHLSRHMTSHNG